MSWECMIVKYLYIRNWYNQNIHGQLSPDFQNLKSLSSLNLSCNYLNGNLDGAVGGLTSLKRFSLFNNSLQGSIPDEIGNLKQRNVTWRPNLHSRKVQKFPRRTSCFQRSRFELSDRCPWNHFQHSSNPGMCATCGIGIFYPGCVGSFNSF